eukprot:8597835-Pyramimonas_sp.AAC.1
MAGPDSDDRWPFAERSDGESVVSPMFFVWQTQGDERAPEGAQTGLRGGEDRGRLRAARGGATHHAGGGCQRARGQ